MRRQQGGEAKHLRRLRPPQVAPRDGLRDGVAGADALQRVGEGNTQDGAVDPVGRDGGQAGVDVGTPHEGTRRVMDRDKIGRRARQRFEAVQDRLLAAGAPRDRRRQAQPLGCGLVMSVISRTDHHPYPIDGRGGLEGRDGPAQDGLAGQKRILLGQRATEAAAAAGRDDQGGTTGHGP